MFATGSLMEKDSPEYTGAKQSKKDHDEEDQESFTKSP
jgi:hypothetical protein